MIHYVSALWTRCYLTTCRKGEAKKEIKKTLDENKGAVIYYKGRC